MKVLKRSLILLLALVSIVAFFAVPALAAEQPCVEIKTGGSTEQWDGLWARYPANSNSWNGSLPFRPLLEDTTYVFSFWMRGDGEIGVWLPLGWFNWHYGCKTFTATQYWTKYTMEFKTIPDPRTGTYWAPDAIQDWATNNVSIGFVNGSFRSSTSKPVHLQTEADYDLDEDRDVMSWGNWDWAITEAKAGTVYITEVCLAPKGDTTTNLIRNTTFDSSFWRVNGFNDEWGGAGLITPVDQGSKIVKVVKVDFTPGGDANGNLKPSPAPGESPDPDENGETGDSSLLTFAFIALFIMVTPVIILKKRVNA